MRKWYVLPFAWCPVHLPLSVQDGQVGGREYNPICHQLWPGWALVHPWPTFFRLIRTPSHPERTGRAPTGHTPRLTMPRATHTPHNQPSHNARRQLTLSPSKEAVASMPSSRSKFCSAGPELGRSRTRWRRVWYVEDRARARRASRMPRNGLRCLRVCWGGGLREGK